MNQPKNKQEGARPTSTYSDQPSPTQPTKAPPTPHPTKPEAKLSSARTTMPPWVRIPLRILRILLVPILCVTALIVGVVFGYVYMGGRNSADVWSLETWRHLFELVFAS